MYSVLGRRGTSEVWCKVQRLSMCEVIGNCVYGHLLVILLSIIVITVTATDTSIVTSVISSAVAFPHALCAHLSSSTTF